MEFASAAAAAYMLMLVKDCAYMHRRHTNLTLAAIVVTVVMIRAHNGKQQRKRLEIYFILFFSYSGPYVQRLITGKIFTHAGLPLTLTCQQ